MTELTQDLSLAQAHSLIDSYAFDLGSDNAEQLLQYWLELYHASWIRLATIEALYLGRYKTISIEHILNVWLRIGTPNTHFTYEFERLICRKLPKHLSNLADMTAAETKISAASFRITDNEQNKPTVQVEQTESQAISQGNPSLGHNVAHDQLQTKDLDSKVANKIDKSATVNASVISALGISYKADWSELTMDNKIIHQFIPLPDVSSFFKKLKTFGEEKLEGQ